MRLKILTFILIFIKAPAHSQMLVDYQEGDQGLKYQISLENIIPGYSSHLVVNNFNIGVMTPPKQEYSGWDFKSLFESAMKRNKSGLKKLKTTTETLSEQTTLPEGKEDNILEENKDQKVSEIEWEAVESCIQFSLPLLKSVYRINKKVQLTEEEARVLEVLKYQLSVREGSGGLACGKTLGPYEDLVVTSPLANIKILLALKGQLPKQRQYLLQSMAGAFASGLSKSSRELFSYYFLRLSWIAAVENAKNFPTYLQMNKELNDNPETQKVQLTKVNGEKFTEVIVMKKYDLAKTYLEGRRFLVKNSYWDVKFIGEN